MLNEIRQLLRWRSLERAARSRVLKNPDGIIQAISHLQMLCPADTSEDHEEPIFLMSAGWRTGSTLLQRLIMSDSRVLMWGEPYHECGLIQNLAESMRPFRSGWPKPKWFYQGTPPGQLSLAWVANLFPAPEIWHKSQRALFNTLFAEQAHEAGAARWGIKEVRLNAEHAFYLRWLYPKSRFVFLYRNPMDAYLSYRRRGGGWYQLYPDKRVFTPTTFGREWRERVEGFLRYGQQLGALSIRFEDLVSGHIRLETIADYLGIRINPAILDIKIDGATPHAKQPRIGPLEKWLLKRSVSPLAENLGYKW